MRDKIARDLESFLLPRDLGYYLDGPMKIGQFPGYPVKLSTNRNNLEFTIDFRNSIQPYINSIFYIDTSYSINDNIKMYISGIPTFKSNGKVKIE